MTTQSSAPDQEKPDQETSGQDMPSNAPSSSDRRNLVKLIAALALFAGGLATLVFGIAIGNAVRKRADRWAHGYR